MVNKDWYLTRRKTNAFVPSTMKPAIINVKFPNRF